MKSLFLVFSLVFVLTQAHAQGDLTIPAHVDYKSQADYDKEEPRVVAAAKWLEETDLDQQTDARATVSAYIMQWISGTSSVTVGISPALVKITDKNPELLMIYLASYSRHYIENRATATKLTAARAGLVSILNVYRKGIKLKRNKELEKVASLGEGDALDAYLKDNFSD